MPLPTAIKGSCWRSNLLHACTARLVCKLSPVAPLCADRDGFTHGDPHPGGLSSFVLHCEHLPAAHIVASAPLPCMTACQT